MPSSNSSNQFLLIKIKFQVLKLLECIEKLNDFERKDAIHFILYRIVQINKSRAKESLNLWGNLTSGHFAGRQSGRSSNERRLLKLNSPEKVTQCVSYWISRRHSQDIRWNSEAFRRFLHLNAWNFLHAPICENFARRIFTNPILELSFHEDEDEDEADGLDISMNDSDAESWPPKAEKRSSKPPQRRVKKAKVPKKEIYPCFHCPKTYRRRQNVVDHYATKHQGYCPDCGEEVGLDAQGKLHHNRSKHLDEYPFVCEMCGESMSRNQQYQIHMEVHTRKPLLDKPEEKPKRKCLPKVNRYAVVFPDGLICPVCGLKFKNPSLLNGHKARQHPANVFQCEICSEVFKLRTSYTRHKRIHTVQDKKFTCESCGLKYTTNSALKDHVRLTHDRVDISCEVCGKNFAMQRFLRRHMKIHSTERPFACDLCPLTFKIRHHLERHRKTVHRDVLEGISGKKMPEKVVEIAKIGEIVEKESTKETFKDLPVATESTLLQMISDQIPTEVLPMANTDPVLPAEMIQSYQENYTYPESYTIPQTSYLPTQDYNINPQEILEIPPENMDTNLLDPSFIPQYPYNVWDNQFDCQNTMNQQAEIPQATYNIGSILSNLELMENNATFDPGYDFFDTTPQQQFYPNGQNCPDTTEILQWQQKIDQYDFNSQNHTLTDISNTFLREEQRQSSNLSSYVNNFCTTAGEEQQVFNANNVNVMLPSLADYLQNHFNPFTVHEDVEQ